MDQPTFGDLEYTHKKHRTRREKFLERLEGLVPWQRLEARIEPHYPNASALCSVGNAAGSPGAALLQPERSWDGGSVVRSGVGAAVCGRASVGAATRREHDPAFPPPAGEASPRAGVVCGDQRVSGGTGGAVTGGNDRGRDHHSGADLYQEPERAAGRGNASGEEGEPVLLWDETAHRSGRRPRGWCTALQRRRPTCTT